MQFDSRLTAIAAAAAAAAGEPPSRKLIAGADTLWFGVSGDLKERR